MFAWAADHLEPGVSAGGAQPGPHQALQFLACVGNQVRVTFRPGSREARALERTPGDAELLGADLRKFVDRLEKQLEFAVLTRVSEKQEFMLAVNVNAVTSNLVERLKKRDDVQYAQPNFLLQKIGVGISVMPF